MIEHFHSWEVPQILQEWRRVLKPGGKLILELPSLNAVIFYMSQIAQGVKVPTGFVLGALYGAQIPERPEMCHKYAYSVESLTKIVKEAGFMDVKAKQARYHFPQRDMRIEGVK